jgi:hypothetical protein
LVTVSLAMSAGTMTEIDESFPKTMLSFLLLKH